MKNKNVNAKSSLWIAILVMVSMLAISCTKERPYDALLKEDKLIRKSKFTIESDMLGNVSSDSIARYASAVRPYWMAQEKRVRFQINENSIDLYEIEKDGRFDDNVLNNAPILTIPVKHVDYQCAEDALGKCTHKEEENKDVEWYNKKYVKVDFHKLKQVAVERLPIEQGNFRMKCFDKKNTKVIDVEVEDGVFNLVLENDYQSNINCENYRSYNWDYNNMSFTMRHHFSFADINMLASPDYQAVNYPREAEYTFGFFKTDVRKTFADNSLMQSQEKFLANRWNPKRKSIDYYLNEAYNKPENAKLKEATYKAVNVINDGLYKAGAKMRVNLREPVVGMRPGDVRYSMIVMVEDPVAAGVLGYGPSVANPITGEIVKANTIMYTGNIKRGLKRTYDMVIRQKLREARGETEFGPGNILLPKAPPVSPGVISEEQVVDQESSSSSSQGFWGGSVVSKESIDQFIAELLQNESQAMNFENVKVKELLKYTEQHQKDLYELTVETGYPEEFVDFHAASVDALDELIAENGLKFWKDLSDEQKTTALDVLMPYHFVPVLIHEIGHNLGLRHNFMGSEDKDNWYTKKELEEEYGFAEGTEFKYSSIMDYGYRTNNELHLLGKYDVAALKFAYGETIEKTDGTDMGLFDFISQPGTPVKSYSYCSDEGVGPNPNCNRFDEGTNMVEIMEHKIRSMESLYERIYHRNDRITFSKFGDARIMMYIAQAYQNIRLHLERVETIAEGYELPVTSREWETNEFLSDLKKSAVMGGKYLTEVVRTPGVMCALAQESNPGLIQEFIPLAEVPGSGRALSCFDGTIKDSLNRAFRMVPVLQTGKTFMPRKDPENPNIYNDQIDIRGFYFNKLLATHFLYTRELGSDIFDGNGRTGNYSRLPEVKTEMDKLVEEVLFDEVSTTLNFNESEIDGLALPSAKFTYGLSDSHIIDDPLHRGVQRALSLPGETVSFSEMFNYFIYAQSRGKLQSLEDSQQRLKLSVTTPDRLRDKTYMEDMQGVSEEDRLEYLTTSAFGRDIVAIKGVHTIAYKAIETLNAIEIMSKATVTQLGKLAEEKTEEGAVNTFSGGRVIISRAKSAAFDENAQPLPRRSDAATAEPLEPELEAKLKKLSVDMLTRYFTGSLKNKRHYQELLGKLYVNETGSTLNELSQ